jgi:hypothetical protein
MINKLPLQKILKGIRNIEDENKNSHECMGIIKAQDKMRQIIIEISTEFVAHTQTLTK